MTSGPNVRQSMEALWKDTLTRLTLVERRIAVAGSGGGGSELPSDVHRAGDIWQVANGVAPANTLLADGRAVPRIGYPELFAKIGTTYGVGDGSTTFNLPNLNGKMVVVPQTAAVTAMNLDGAFRILSSTTEANSVLDAYEIHVNITPNGAAARPYLRMRVGGVTNSLGAWNYNRIMAGSNGTVVGGTATNATSLAVSADNTSARTMFHGEINRPGAPDYTEVRFFSNSRNGADPWMQAEIAGSFWQNTSFDGVQLFLDSGISFSGYVAVIPVGGSIIPSVIAIKDFVDAGTPGSGTYPSLPDPVTRIGPDTGPITWAVGAWGDVANCAVTFTLPQAMWVEANFGANVSGSGTSYGMLGVVVTGALNLPPEMDQATGATPKYGLTPFSTNSNIRIHGNKLILLPAGTSTITMQTRRSGSTATNADYATMTVTPLYWVGAPGVAKVPGTMVGAVAKSIVTVGGSAVQAGHKVSFTSVSKVSLNGIFDTLVADDYMIECVITGATQGGWIRLRKNGVDTEGAVYGNQQVWNNAASTLTTAYSATTGWVFIPVTGLLANFTAKITSAPLANPLTVHLDLESNVLLSSGMTNGSSKGTTSAQSYDGFTIASAAGTISGWLRVYALT